MSSFAEYSKPVTDGILELTTKLKGTTISFHKINPTNIIQTVGIAPVITVGTDDNTIVNAEEAMEVPPIIPIDITTPLIADLNKIPEHNGIDKRRNTEDGASNDRRELFRRIGQQEFEDVVFTPRRRSRKRTRSKMAGNKSEHDVSLVNGDYSSSSLHVDDANANTATTTHSSLLSLSLEDKCLLKLHRDLERIQQDVENKEKLLANILDFDSVLSKCMTSCQMDDSGPNISNRMDTITYINCRVNCNDIVNEEQDVNEEESNEQSDHTETESGEEDVSYRTELKKLEDLGECRKMLLQNNTEDIPQAGNNAIDIRQVQAMMDCYESEFNASVKESVTFPTVEEEEEEDWVLVKDDIPSVTMF